MNTRVKIKNFKREKYRLLDLYFCLSLCNQVFLFRLLNRTAVRTIICYYHYQL